MKILALLSVFLALPVAAQTARVIELSPEDAKLAKTLYEQKVDIETKIEKLNLHMRDYLVDIHHSPCHESPTCVTTGTTVKRGWESLEVEFSEDFRFIVPKNSGGATSGTSGTLTIANWPAVTSCPSNLYYPPSTTSATIPNSGSSTIQTQ